MYEAYNPVTFEQLECESFSQLFRAALKFLRMEPTYCMSMSKWRIQGESCRYVLFCTPHGNIVLVRRSDDGRYVSQFIGHTTVN